MAHVTDGTDKRMQRLIAPTIFCRACGSPLVQAADWEQEEESHWSIRLWCPECGFERAATLDRPQLLYLSLAIEDGFGWMLQALSEHVVRPNLILGTAVGADNGALVAAEPSPLPGGPG